MIKAAEEAKNAKQTLQNQINKTNNDNIKKSNEDQKNIEILNKKRIQDLQAAEKIKANSNNMDPFGTTRKFSSLISQKTRRRKQTSRQVCNLKWV